MNRVVPDDQLDQAVDHLLLRATRGSRASKALGKQTIYAQLDRPEADAYAVALEVMASASQLPGAREGMAAFLEKRPPVVAGLSRPAVATATSRTHHQQEREVQRHQVGQRADHRWAGQHAEVAEAGHTGHVRAGVLPVRVAGRAEQLRHGAGQADPNIVQPTIARPMPGRERRRGQHADGRDRPSPAETATWPDPSD